MLRRQKILSLMLSNFSVSILPDNQTSEEVKGEKRREIAFLLKALKPDVDALMKYEVHSLFKVQEKKMSMLHYCCCYFYGNQMHVHAVMHDLLDAGANPWLLDEEGLTPRQVLMGVDIKAVMHYHLNPIQARPLILFPYHILI